MKKILKCIRSFLKKIKCSILDFRSYYYLKKISKKTNKKGKAMYVAFIVFEPETWDKLTKVYYELIKRENIIVELIVVPSFDNDLCITREYGKELEFFLSVDEDLICACGKDRKWVKIDFNKYDYLFYQDPYNGHMPSHLKSINTVKYTKICYLPYGCIGSEVFYANNTLRSFFRNVYCEFIDDEELQELQNNQFKTTVDKGLQKFVRLGYPPIVNYYGFQYSRIIKKVLWTPRWSYHPVIGGSHFLEYKDSFIELKDKYDELSFTIRPHPMMFKNLINKELMEKDGDNRFIELAENKGINISIQRELKDDFMEADILITDFSSMIPQFFVTGKPIIYCKSNIPLNKSFSKIAEGMYVASEWKQIEQYLNDIIYGNDYLLEKRKEIIDELVGENIDSEKRIVDYLVDDYKSSLRG